MTTPSTPSTPPAPTAPPAPPAPAAPAAGWRRVGAQARFEARILLRNFEQLLVAVVLPALALVALTLADVPDLGTDRRVDVVTPGVLALAVLSTAFTGQAIQIGFDRRYGVLRLLATTPLGRGGLLAGKLLAVLLVELVQVVVLGAVALGLGWAPRATGLPAAVLLCLAGSAAFVSLALLLAGTLRAEAVLAVANLAWVLLLGLGGVLLPVDRLPAALASVAPWLPSGALGEGLRTALGAGALDLRALAVLLGWTVAAAALARRVFRWDA